MDYTEADKAEQERRKQAQIEFRNKKRYSAMFMFFACVFEIIETFIIIFVGIIVISFFMFKVFNADPEVYGTLFSILLIVDLIGGLFLGFFIYKKVITWVIKKKNIKDKLSDDIINHYFTDPRQELKKRQKR